MSLLKGKLSVTPFLATQNSLSSSIFLGLLDFLKNQIYELSFLYKCTIKNPVETIVNVKAVNFKRLTPKNRVNPLPGSFLSKRAIIDLSLLECSNQEYILQEIIITITK